MARTGRVLAMLVSSLETTLGSLKAELGMGETPVTRRRPGPKPLSGAAKRARRAKRATSPNAGNPLAHADA